MMRRVLGFAVVVVATSLPTSAGADRVVNYAIDETAAAHDAAEQGVALAPLPARGPTHIAVEIAPSVDHQVLRVGISCSAWKVQNPMTGLLQRFLTAWDRGGAPAPSLGPSVGLVVKIERAATLSRCVSTGEMKSTCITRVSIDGSTARPGEEPRPFHVEREEAAKGVGVCAGLTRGIGLVSRQAASALIGYLDQSSTEPRTTS